MSIKINHCIFLDTIVLQTHSPTKCINSSMHRVKVLLGYLSGF